MIHQPAAVDISHRSLGIDQEDLRHMAHATEGSAVAGQKRNGILPVVALHRAQLGLARGRDEAPVRPGIHVLAHPRHLGWPVAFGIEADRHQSHAIRQVVAIGQRPIEAPQSGEGEKLVPKIPGRRGRGRADQGRSEKARSRRVEVVGPCCPSGRASYHSTGIPKAVNAGT